MEKVRDRHVPNVALAIMLRQRDVVRFGGLEDAKRLIPPVSYDERRGR